MPTIVYIAGSGRSGSTLLERTLGALPGYANVGELLDLPRRVAPGDELCGCGAAFSQCLFWSAVGESLPRGWDPEWLFKVHGLQTRVARQRHLPRLLVGTVSGQFGRDLTAYADALGSIYSSVASVSGADVVVDASKWPSLALALHRGGLDVRVIHLVRDVRGVAQSLSGRDVQRPHAGPSSTEPMYHNPPVSAAGRWLATQTEADLLAVRGVPVARMAYERFVRDPAGEIIAALRSLDLPVAEDISYIEGHTITLTSSHGLSGNPSRFSEGDIVLRPDERWRTAMTSRDRIVVETIGAPQLFRSRRAALERLAEPLTPVAPEPADDVSLRAGGRYPLVSVVLPTRGRPELVRDAIASVVAQDYPGEVELVVVHDQEEEDQGLTEATQPRRSVAVTSNTRTPGLTGSRNTGLGMVEGEFIASLDDDDSWHPQKLRRQVDRFNSDPDVLALGSGIRLILPEGRTAEWFGRSEYVRRELLLRNRVKELHSSTLVMRRDAFAKAGLYDEGLPNGYAEDWDIVLRIAQVGRIGIVREPLADIRKDGHSYYRGRAANTAPALAHFLEQHPEIVANRRGHARMLGQMGFARSSLGERRVAAKLALRGMSRWPLSPHPYVAMAHVATGADPAAFARLARRLGRGMA